MTTYIGFYYPNPDYVREIGQQARTGELPPQAGQGFSPQMAQKVRELPSVLPQGCKLIGSYARTGYQSAGVPEEHQLPGIIIVETDNPADLAAFNTHYLGYLSCAWYPYTPVTRT